MKYLLDVNTLIAAIWQPHQHFAKADAWVKGKDLVTCPLSELGFLRIGTNPKALGLSMPMARTLLEEFTKNNGVDFLPADIPALDGRPNTSDQVTDLYLAELAARHNMKLATLDTSLSHPAAVSI